VAGIGWRLERLIDHGVAGAAAAYATGAAVMALPWVLTTVVLVSLPLVVGPVRGDLTAAGIVVNTAYAVALLIAGPIQVVVSRYAADRRYERRPRASAAPFCRGLAATFVICAVVTALALVELRMPPRAVLWGAALSASVGAQWTALSVGNGLCSPTLVLGAVGAGAAVSFLFVALLVAVTGLGLSGYLYGLIIGQILTLVFLLAGVLDALPADTDEKASLLPAFRDYAALAGAGFAFNASLWIDKLIVWWLLGGEQAAAYTAASTIAWFSTIPCLAWVFVEVETRFRRRFRGFFMVLEGGAPLVDLRLGVRDLGQEAARLLRGAAAVQASVTLFLEMAAGPLTRVLKLPAEAVLSYRLLLLAAGAEAVGLLGLVLLYYFDFRRDAFLAAGGLLLGVTVCTGMASALGWAPSLGTLLGCFLGATLTWRRVFRSVSEVLEHTLLGQPFGVARTDGAQAKRA
jgi:uncharacterized membrane protein